jgi:hypothetical protein
VKVFEAFGKCSGNTEIYRREIWNGGEEVVCWVGEVLGAARNRTNNFVGICRQFWIVLVARS